VGVTGLIGLGRRIFEWSDKDICDYGSCTKSSAINGNIFNTISDLATPVQSTSGSTTEVSQKSADKPQEVREETQSSRDTQSEKERVKEKLSPEDRAKLLVYAMRWSMRWSDIRVNGMRPEMR